MFSHYAEAHKGICIEIDNKNQESKYEKRNIELWEATTEGTDNYFDLRFNKLKKSR